MSINNHKPFILQNTGSHKHYDFYPIAKSIYNYLHRPKNRKWKRTFNILNMIARYGHFSHKLFVKDNLRLTRKPRYKAHHSIHNANAKKRAYFGSYSREQWEQIMVKLSNQVFGKGAVTKAVKDFNIKKRQRKLKKHLEAQTRELNRKIRSKKLAQTAKKKYKKVSANFLHIDEAKCKKQAENELSVINEALGK